MFKEQPKNIEIKKPRYWHKAYFVPVEKDDIKNWNKEEKIKLVGEYTDAEWKEFIEKSKKDYKGEPIINGRKIDRDGNIIEK
jgi:hypothetical protein